MKSPFDKFEKITVFVTIQQMSKEADKINREHIVIGDIKQFGIQLRQFQPDDATAIFNLIVRNREFLSEFTKIPEKYPTLEAVSKSIIEPENPDKIRFGIWNSDDELVGSINLTPSKNDKKTAEVGYYLGENFTNNGHILKALLLVAGYAFYRGNLERLVASCIC